MAWDEKSQIWMTFVCEVKVATVVGPFTLPPQTES